MLKEYDLWFQKRKITPACNLPKIVCAQEGGGEIAGQALKEYRNGIERLLGFLPEIKDTDETKEAVFLGKPCCLGKRTDFKEKPEDEGFVIKATESSVYIASYDERGLLYGVFRFLSLLARGQIKDGFEICDNPACALRMINHWDNFDGSVERGYAGKSIFYKDGFFDYDKTRIEDYARLLASIGINRLSINNVNVRAKAKLLITEEYLQKAGEIASIFRPFGIRLVLSINFGSPWSLGGLPTADPLDPQVQDWWNNHVKIIYKYIPDLAGFIVKADSEGEPGPFQYGRTHADGANMLAKALAPFGGEVIWRCFVYNCTQDWRDHSLDRVRAAYDNFMPLDGAFAENVILQIKFGPLDFQVREPVTPLFGALKKTRHVMELQITQEYTGHQIDLCYLPTVWEDIAAFDTACGENTRIKDLASRRKDGNASGFQTAAPVPCMDGFAAVVNVGLDSNWTGHTLAQANLYGYGRFSWNPAITAKEVAREWCVLSFAQGAAAEKVEDILLRSYGIYEKYVAPFGMYFMVTPGLHYGPNIEGYEYSRWGTYHRADMHAIGIDRTPSGTGFTQQYSPQNAKIFSDPASCPENLLLFFHRLRYDYVMKNGKTLLQNIYDTHFEAYDEAAQMLEDWKKLKDLLEKEVYESVLSRFERQLLNAREWRDQINTYFWRKTGIPDEKGRKIYE